MKFKNCFSSKLLVMLSNILFLVCGIVLLSVGAALYTDSRRILLSRLLLAEDNDNILARLPRPLFYYVALALMGAGLVTCTAAVTGCAASCAKSYCLLTIYSLIVVGLLILQGLACAVLWLWPHCLGLGMDETQMVKALQRNYGVPGEEQFTAAMDLVQVVYDCCAVNDSINYDTSLWRLQGLGHRELAVPLTCCHLDNSIEQTSYVDPKPVNLTKCQALIKEENQNSRHQKGCLPDIEQFYQHHYTIFISASFIFVVIEFSVLLTAMLSCSRLPSRNRKRKSITSPLTVTTIMADRTNRTTENIYNDELALPDMYIPRDHLYRKNVTNTSYRSATGTAPKTFSYRGYIV